MEKSNRRQVGKWAEQYLAGDLTGQRFLELAPAGTDDDLIAELIDLIEHEPKREGILGATPEQHDEYGRRMRELIRTLCDS